MMNSETAVGDSLSLHQAAKEGNLDAIRMCIANGIDIDTKDEDDRGNTALHVAAEHGQVHALKELIALNANRDLRNDDYNRMYRVNAILNEQTDINTNQQPERLGNTPLHVAIMHKQLDAVKVLIEEKADINSKDTNDHTPLHLAAKEGDIDILLELIEAGANMDADGGRRPVFYQKSLTQFNKHMNHIVDYQEILKNTPLHTAIKHKQFDAAKVLISKGVNINFKDTDNGYTPLHLAAQQGIIGILVLLIEKVEIDVQGHYGNTPLHLAAEHGHIEALRVLIDYGADKEIKDSLNNTPLNLAVSNLRENTSIELIKSGADVNTKDSTDNTPLHHLFLKFMTNNINSTVYATTSTNILKALKAAGADTEARNTNGFTPLHLAASMGIVDILVALVSKGADIEARDIGGRTPLHLATQAGKFSTIIALGLLGADINARDSNNLKPIDTEYLSGNLNSKTYALIELIKEEIERKARGDSTHTPVRSFVLENSPQNVPQVNNHQFGANLPGNANNFAGIQGLQNLLCNAIEKEQLDKLKKIIEKGANPSFIHNGKTYLHLAVQFNKQVDVLKALIDAGVNLEARFQGYTPLHLAAQYGRVDALKALKDAGADKDAKDSNGFTPLHLAARYGQLDALRVLLDGGADTESKDNDGFTPLHLAAQYDQFFTLIALVDKGANIQTKNINSYTPLHLAYLHNQNSALIALLVLGADTEAKDKDGLKPRDFWDNHRDPGIYGLIELIEMKAEKIIENISASRPNAYNTAGTAFFTQSTAGANAEEEDINTYFNIENEFTNPILNHKNIVQILQIAHKKQVINKLLEISNNDPEAGQTILTNMEIYGISEVIDILFPESAKHNNLDQLKEELENKTSLNSGQLLPKSNEKILEKIFDQEDLHRLHTTPGGLFNSWSTWSKSLSVILYDYMATLAQRLENLLTTDLSENEVTSIILTLESLYNYGLSGNAVGNYPHYYPGGSDDPDFDKNAGGGSSHGGNNVTQADDTSAEFGLVGMFSMGSANATYL